MYPFELESYIKEHDYNLTGRSLLCVIDVAKNPQLKNIIFHPEDNTYDLWDVYGNHYVFKAIPNNEKEKVYIKNMNR